MAHIEDFFTIYNRMEKLVKLIFEDTEATNIQLVNFDMLLFQIRITVKYSLNGQEKTIIVKFAQSCVEWGKNWKTAVERNKKVLNKTICS